MRRDSQVRNPVMCSAYEGVHAAVNGGTYYTGYSADASGGNYDRVYAVFRNPLTYNGCEGESFSAWTGLQGGRGLLQNGVAVLQADAPFAFFEYISKVGGESVAVTPLGNITVRGGDLMYADTYYDVNSDTARYYVSN